MNRLSYVLMGLVGGLALLAAPAARAQVHTIQGEFFGKSPPASALPTSKRGEVRQVKPLRHPHPVLNERLAAPNDTALQLIPGPEAAVVKGPNVDGLGVGFPGHVNCCAPPDTNAAVGPTQIVETVNDSYAVFNKTTGAPLTGSIDLADLFSGVGTNCQTGFVTDPVVLFDKGNNRWVIPYLAGTNGGPIGISKPFLQCFAVSSTSDATGTYLLYAFDVSSLGGGAAGALNDYGKLAIWPDAYYMGFNEFSGSTGAFLGAAACAFQSAAMVIGFPPSMICFPPIRAEDSLFPASSDGPLPPSGSPAFFVGTLNGSNSFHLWKFHVDFGTPGNSTFTGPTTITTAAYSEACGGGTCIQQPAGGELLDSLADRLMYRRVYRHFSGASDPEWIIVTHSVTAGASSGIRWYEIRDPNGTPAVFQQGTFAPDGAFRWMGSAAMDKKGNIAIGYSVSSGSIFPSIRVTGRTASMPAGTLASEISVVNGGGVQQGTFNRWGDYSSMSVDPVDDCTFWYAQEYIKANGSFNWSTRLASFRIKSCK